MNNEVKIFIGHSTKDFKDSIQNLKEFLEELSSSFGASIKVMICEDKTVSGQDEINEKWIKPSDIAFFCFKDRVGDFSKEELEVAVEEYIKNKFNPQIFVYIQQGNENEDKLQEIIDKLEKDYRIFHFDFDEYAIKLRFAQNVSQTLGGEGKVKAEGRKVFIDDKPINLPVKELSAIKKNDNYNALQAEIKKLRNLRDEAEEDGEQEKYYELSEQINAKIAEQIQMEKDALKIYEYLNNQLKKDDADEDAIKALALATQGKIEEGLALLPIEQLLEQSKTVVEAYNIGNQLTQNAKENATKLTEKINARIDILMLKMNENGVIDEIIELYKALIEQSKVLDELYYELELTAFLITHNKTEEAYEVAKEYVERIESFDFDNEQQQAYTCGVAYNNVANCCNLLSKIQEAEEYLLKAIEVYDALVEIDRDFYIEDLAETYYNLSVLYVNLSKSEETEEILLKTIKLREELAEKNRDAYIDSLANCYTIIAALYNRISKTVESESYSLKAIEIYEELYENDGDVYLDMLAINYIGIATFYNNNFDFNKALDYNGKAVELLLKGLETDSESRKPYLAMCYMNMAIIYIATKDYDKALKNCLFAKELYEKLCEIDYDRNIWQLAIVYDNLASVYLSTKDYELAEENNLKALEIREELYALDDVRFAPELCKTYNEIGLMYHTLKRNDEAEEYFAKALELANVLIERDSDMHTPLMAQICYNLNRYYFDNDNLDKALEFLEFAQQLYDSLAKLDYQRFIGSLMETFKDYVKIYEKIVKTDATEENHKNIITARQVLYEYNKSWYFGGLSTAYNNLALFYKNQKRYDDAEVYYAKAVELREKHLDLNNHTGVYYLSIICNNASQLCSVIGKHDKAESYSLRSIELIEPIASEKPEYKKHLITCYVRTSWVYHDKGDKQKVKEYVDKSKQYEEKQ